MIHQNTDYFSAAYLKENKPFFLTLFAIHSQFSADDLVNFKNILPLGSGGYSMVIDSGSHVIWASYGLAFNRHIEWTDTLRNLYHKTSNLLYAGAWQDEWFRVDFNQFPLNPEDEIDFARNQWLENDFKAFEFDDEGNGISPMDDLGSKFLAMDYSEVSLEEIKKLIDIYCDNFEMLIPSFIFNNSFFERVKYCLQFSVSKSLWMLFL